MLAEMMHEKTAGNSHTVAASASIDAAPERVYKIIADYREGHPSIAPEEFSDLTVEAGGVGHGTIIRYRMRLMGIRQWFRASVTEPEPGRVLVETDLDSNGAVTTFTVNPGAGSRKSEVLISTELPVRAGFLGRVQRYLATRYLRPIYLKELALLARRASEGTAPSELIVEKTP